MLSDSGNDEVSTVGSQSLQASSCIFCEVWRCCFCKESVMVLLGRCIGKVLVKQDGHRATFQHHQVEETDPPDHLLFRIFFRCQCILVYFLVSVPLISGVAPSGTCSFYQSPYPWQVDVTKRVEGFNLQRYVWVPFLRDPVLTVRGSFWTRFVLTSRIFRTFQVHS